MSAILEEGIGFGGTDAQPTTSAAKNVLKQKITSLEESKSNDDSSFNKKTIAEIFAEANQGNPNYNPPKLKHFEESFAETKKLLQTYRKKMANYPKYISYEGSLVLCVMLSMESPALVQLKNLPPVDQSTIIELIKNTQYPLPSQFYVQFDACKDFVISFQQSPNDSAAEVITMFSSIMNLRPEDNLNTVPIENCGDTIKIGGKFTVDKRTVRTILKMPAKTSENPNVEEDILPKRQPVSGRNAFEIREDILEAAIDVVKFANMSRAINLNSDEFSNECLKIAAKFYEFVENKNHKR